MFNTANIPKYLLLFGIILIASYIGKRYTRHFEGNETKDEYRLIQQYLLNESPLYGYNKPKLWIHTKYEYNSRIWKSFQSRSSTDLNQPYIHLTIKSVVLHCADDFNICLIDDDTFSKLIPTWTVEMGSLADPAKTRAREYGLALLTYLYGGMVVPNSFICRRNLKDLYKEGIEGGTPFMCEALNRSANSTAGGQASTFSGDPDYIVDTTASGLGNRLAYNAKQDLHNQSNNPTLKQSRQRLVFLPNAYFMGAKKNDPVMLEIVEYLKGRVANPHFSSESAFLGDYQQWALSRVMEGKIRQIDGDMVGVKTVTERRPVLLEDLLEEGFIDIRPEAYGIYIPEAEVLRRNKYQWFAVMSGEEILQSRMAVSKYLVESIVNYLPPLDFKMADADERLVGDIKMKERTVFTI